MEETLHSMVALDWEVLVKRTPVGVSGLLGPKNISEAIKLQFLYVYFVHTIYSYCGCGRRLR